jgi:hypothetical protein
MMMIMITSLGWDVWAWRAMVELYRQGTSIIPSEFSGNPTNRHIVAKQE